MTERRDETYHAALASPTRRKVLDALNQSPMALDADAISGAVGLHVTTVRFHLEQLEDAGLVLRTIADDRRRGRPRVLFQAVLDTDRDDRSREQLIEVLAGALEHSATDEGRSRSIDAGRAWARSLVAEQPRSGDRQSSVDRQGTLLTVLAQLGFEPEAEGDTVQLRACPFRDAARQHPQVVCSIHQGLVQQILSGQDEPSDARLLPFVQPELCVITSA